MLRTALQKATPRVTYHSSGTNTGGLVGITEASITKSYTLGNVHSSGTNTGGLVGKSTDSITASYTMGNVISDSGTNTGGLVGTSDGNILASYTLSKVSSNSDSYTGGLVGLCRNGIISASYSAAALDEDNTNGLIGFRITCTVNYSYWDINLSGVSDDGDATTGVGKSHMTLVAPVDYVGIYDSWNVTGIGAPSDTGPWIFGTTTHLPYLWWQSADNIISPDVYLPDQPVDLSVTPNYTSILFSWTAPDSDGGFDITGYTVQYTTLGTDWTTYLDGTNDDDASTTTSINITDLTLNTQYTFRVAAVSSIGQGAYSANVTATTNALTVPDAPTISPNPTVTLDSVSISWNKPDNGGSPITGYSVQYVTSGGSSWSTHQNGNTTLSTTIPDLTSNTEYTFRVAAVNTVGQGAYSANVTDTTKAPTVPSVPTEITIPDTTANSVLVIWLEPSDDGGSPIIGYTVDYAVASSGTWQTQDSALIDNDTKSSTISGLTPNTEYNVRVAAVNSVGQGAYSANATDTTDAPTVPVAPTISPNPSVTLDSVSISWNKPDNGGSPITGYSVQYVTSGGSSWSTHQDGNTTSNTALSATIYDLNYNTEYTFRVAAVNTVGQGAYSANVTDTTKAPTVPSALVLITIPDTTANSVLVIWLEPSDDGGSPIIGYTVDYAVASSGTWQTQDSALIDNDTKSSTISGLTPNTEYNVRVAAVNSVGQGAYSANATDTTDALTVPNAPTISPNPSVTLDSVSISWNKPDNGGSPITGYSVQYVTSGGSSWSTHQDGNDTSNTALSATIPGLTPNTEYTFRVAAVNTVGQGAYSANVTDTTKAPTVPGVPNAFTIIDPTDNSVFVSWSEPDNGGSDIIGYTVDYAVASNGTWQTQDSALINNNDRITTFTDLNSNTQYNFRVAAVNGIGQGAYSANVTATTDASTVPDAPTISPNPTVTLDSVSISWNKPDNGGSPITGYSVQYVASGGSSWSTHQDGNDVDNTALSTTIPSLTPNTEYTFRVAAVNAVNQGAYSANVTATTDAPTVPDAPIISPNPTVTLDSVTISWNKPDNGGSPITGYSVQYVASGGSSWSTHQNGHCSICNHP